MATEFLMPKLGLTMEEGTITEWFADDGNSITAGEPLLRIETDKTETDVEAAFGPAAPVVGGSSRIIPCCSSAGGRLCSSHSSCSGCCPCRIPDHFGGQQRTHRCIATHEATGR